MRALPILLLSALSTLAGAGGVRAETVRFPSVAAGSSAAGPEISGWIYRPAGPGPFPAIVLAHTCGGTSAHTDAWGKLLTGWGYLVLAADSFGPRGHKQVCTNGAVTGNQRVADIAGALKYLAALPEVQPWRIGLIGHSHGGWTTMRAVQGSFGLAALGGCAPRSPTIRPARRSSTATSPCRC